MKYFELSYQGSQFQIKLDNCVKSIAITHGSSTIKFETREVKDSTMSLPKQISGASCTALVVEPALTKIIDSFLCSALAAHYDAEIRPSSYGASVIYQARTFCVYKQPTGVSITFAKESVGVFEVGFKVLDTTKIVAIPCEKLSGKTPFLDIANMILVAAKHTDEPAIKNSLAAYGANLSFFSTDPTGILLYIALKDPVKSPVPKTHIDAEEPDWCVVNGALSAITSATEYRSESTDSSSFINVSPMGDGTTGLIS